ncbi:hypothetical protein AWJ20_1150 [Sugiyamaella lignohabitans]|uniref:EGF-like domain-containing protein n=1 Tax=Sugiyamaella lignohabitans TaxID=796027 RepID=A0A167DFW3_9ASCO|nr:uncharacterized protein AWJ20_1150 [Sugiyamaella lignohabitans]ANB12872.1 hypothetical protein AWJ20_1150 [Sugiyamaella lignohabitans]
MKLTNFYTSGLASAVVMASSVKGDADCNSGSVYIFNGGSDKVHHDQQKPLVMNMDQTQLVLADFAGVDDAETIKDLNDAYLIENIRSKYHTHQGLLSKGQPQQPVVVMVENLPENRRKEFLGASPAFTIDWEHAHDGFFPELVEKWAKAAEDLYNQAKHLVAEGSYFITGRKTIDWNRMRSVHIGRDESDEHVRAVQDEAQDLRLAVSNLVDKDDRAFIHLTSLAKDCKDSYEDSVQTIEDALHELISNAHVGYRVAVIVPPGASCSSSDDNEDQDHESKHQGKKHHGNKHHGKKHHNKDSDKTEYNKKSHSKHHNKNSNHIVSEDDQAEVRLPLDRRDLPVSPAPNSKGDVRATFAANGFKTLEKCEQSTNSCSGHGSCVSTNYGTFVCACKPSYDASKKKTTNWGGSACQKKDVSIEFQLFFWTGLGILLALYWAISVLFSIGSEPLPGILGVAKKSA